MKWHQFHIVHSDDMYSIQVAKFLMQLSSFHDNFCALSMEQYTSFKKLGSDYDDTTLNVNQDVIASVLSDSKTVARILVILHKSSVKNFLESVNEYIQMNNVTGVEMLFSQLLTHEEYKLISKETTKIYSLSAVTENTKSFEEYWQNQIHRVKVSKLR